MKDGFMDEIKFAKLPNEFDVSQHFDLGNCALLFLLGCERAILFIVH
jgi:hypothetical protein